MVLGENGIAFATDLSQVLSFDLATGAVNWTWQPPRGPVEIIMATAGNGIFAKNRDDNTGLETVVRLDSFGTPTYESWSNPSVQYAGGDLWLGQGSLDAISASQVLWPMSVWPIVEGDGMRKAKWAVRLHAARVTEAQVADAYVREKVNLAISYWQMNAGILITWDQSIADVPGCATDSPTCTLNGPLDITDLAQVGLSEIVRRFPALPKGVQVLFIRTFIFGASGSVHGYTIPEVRNADGIKTLVILRDGSSDVLVPAHEFGHIFGLDHVGTGPFALHNLMCAEDGYFSGALAVFYPCLSASANRLTDDQRKTALATAQRLAEPSIP